MNRIQALLFLLTFLIASGWGYSQEILFVETGHIQQAMEEYKRRFNDNSEIPGYRIQYLFTTDRREMERTERNFDMTYGYIPHEWEHDQPYYRLYAGSFLNKSSAMQLLFRIRKDFPEALLINASVPIDKVIECRRKLREK